MTGAPMSETPRSSTSGVSQSRRRVLKLALGVGLCLPRAKLATAQDGDPRKARPQPNDRFVFARGSRKGEAITLADLPAGGPPLIAFPIDPLSKTIRDGSRLNEVLLVRLESTDFSTETRARAADGTVVAYSAVCTHTGCDEWDWQRASGTIKCPCHFSEFDLKDSARVMNGPAPRRLPALPLTIVDGVPVVAGGFVGRPGFEAGGG
jgi:rieske iron-sulfur protein